MLSKVFVIAAFAGCVHLCASSIISDRMRDAAKKIKDKSLERAASQNDTAWDRLAEVVDTFGPRFSGSDALESALDWFVASMQADGLNVTTEPVSIPHWIRGAESLQMLAPRPQKLHMVGLGGSAGTGGTPLEAEVEVFASFDEFEEKI